MELRDSLDVNNAAFCDRTETVLALLLSDTIELSPSSTVFVPLHEFLGPFSAVGAGGE